MANVCLIATMDTKAAEARFLRARLERLGLTVDVYKRQHLRHGKDGRRPARAGL